MPTAVWVEVVGSSSTSTVAAVVAGPPALEVAAPLSLAAMLVTAPAELIDPAAAAAEPAAAGALDALGAAGAVLALPNTTSWVCPRHHSSACSLLGKPRKTLRTPMMWVVVSAQVSNIPTLRPTATA